MKDGVSETQFGHFLSYNEVNCFPYFNIFEIFKILECVLEKRVTNPTFPIEAMRIRFYA